MKCYVFGTGDYSLMYSKYIDKDSIVAFVDNNSEKWDKLFQGIVVISPQKMLVDAVDYVFVLINHCENVIEQLKCYGFADEKILIYSEIYKVLNNKAFIKVGGGEKIYWRDWIKTGDKNVLLISHDMTRTGVPVAVMHMAELFSEMGWNILYGSLRGGSLSSDLDERKIDYIDCLDVLGEDGDFQDFLCSFRFVMAGTIATSEFLHRLFFYTNPIFIWINEKYTYEFETYRLPNHRDNVFYFADGESTVNVFQRYYPSRNIEELYYFLPDEEIAIKNNSKEEKLLFAFVGAMSERKAPDLLIKAIEMMPDHLVERVDFLFIGRKARDLSINWDDVLRKYSNVRYIEEVSQSELLMLFSEIDVLVCPSRDDTVPIVVTQALQNSIPCIVSDQVGQAKFIKELGGGIVFNNNNVDELTNAIIFFIENRKSIKGMGEIGRLIFDNHFSKNAVKKYVTEKIINRVESKVIVSIICPIYYGINYMNQIIKQVEKAVERYKQLYSDNNQFELLFVNDVPGDKLPTYQSKEIIIREFDSEINRGIQGARIFALSYAEGEYIHFLDQDDEIAMNFYSELLPMINQDKDVVFCRCLDGDRPTYNYDRVFEETIERINMLSRPPMISPGQALIRSKSIPKFWKDNILVNSGSDDYMLWLCMTANRCNFALCNKVLFRHVRTGGNYSMDILKLNLSDREMVALLIESGLFKDDEIDMIKEIPEKQFRRKYKAMLRGQIILRMLEIILLGEQYGFGMGEYFKIIKIKTIAIYGAGVLGERIKAILEKKGIEVMCYIDSNAPFVMEDVIVTSLDGLESDMINRLDGILLSYIDDEKQIVNYLKKHIDINVYTIREIVERIYLEIEKKRMKQHVRWDDIYANWDCCHGGETKND